MTNHPKTQRGHIKGNDIFMRVNDVSREWENGRMEERQTESGREGKDTEWNGKKLRK